MKKKPYLKKNEVYLLSPNFKRRKWCELYDMNLNFWSISVRWEQQRDTFLTEKDANITNSTSNSVQIDDTHRGEEGRNP